MSIIVNILLFLLVISALTFVHELGHFLAAKLVKAKVLDFSIGYGPKILSKKIKKTEYNIRILPFGGFVKILGDGDSTDEKESKKDKGNLKNKNKIAQMFVMLAGVTMNLILAITLYTIFLSANSWRMELGPEYEDFNAIGAKIVREKISNIPYRVADEGGALESGIYEEGYLNLVNGVEIDDSDQLIEILGDNRGKSVDVYACNLEEECKFFEVWINDEGKMGIYTGYNHAVFLDYSGNKIFSGILHSVNVIKITGEVLSSMFSQARETGDYSELSNTVSGPIGIYFIIDYFKTLGIITFLGIVADLSISLAVINLLPVPALDGGRVFILLIESVLRKDLNEKVERIVINVSFLLLIVSVILVMIKDIINIDRLQSLFG